MAGEIDDLTEALSRFPGIGPRQARRFVYYLLSVSPAARAKLSNLIANLANHVRQCSSCLRFAETNRDGLCNYCSDTSRDDALLMVLEKDQDLAAVERAGTYRGRYFVLGGVLTLSGKGAIRERELVKSVEKRTKQGLKEIVLALSATSEGEHTADRVRELLAPFRDGVKLSLLGRGLSTGSELEYADAATLSSALINRKKHEKETESAYSRRKDISFQLPILQEMVEHQRRSSAQIVVLPLVRKEERPSVTPASPNFSYQTACRCPRPER
jgi:recombination protein RecR